MATNKELSRKVKELKAENEALKNGKPYIDIIYPNVEKFVQWEELKYSLRSIEKNLIDVEFRIWIVGDKPEWINNEARFIDVPCTGKSTRLDQAVKRIAVDKHKEVSEEYFWMNDDIYFINPVTYADLCLPKILWDLKKHINRYNPQTTWGADMRSTFERLVKENLPTLNYAIHAPYRYEKAKSKELFRLFDLEKNPYVFENLYFNLYYPHLLPYYVNLDETNNLLCIINRKHPNWDTVANQIKIKKFFNHSEEGLSNGVKDMLQSMFPEKSRFEK